MAPSQTVFKCNWKKSSCLWISQQQEKIVSTHINSEADVVGVANGSHKPKRSVILVDGLST